MLTLLASTALAQPVVHAGPARLVETHLNEATVLAFDLDKGVIAYRLNVNRGAELGDDGEIPPTDCHYAGLGENSAGAGVMLGLWDVAKVDNRQTWWVYPTSPCLPHEQSVERLAAAKAAFSAAGLDIRQPPELPRLSGAGTVTVAGHLLHTTELPMEVLRTVETGPDLPGGRRGYDLTVDGELACRRAVAYHREMAGSLRLSPSMVLQQGDRLVIGERYTLTTMRGERSGFGFGPLVLLK